MAKDIVIDVEGFSKKFCRNFKRSLWYGLNDIGRELTGQARPSTALRAGEFWAVDDASFQLRRGECLGLIGPNGAGKTTLLRGLNGLVKPDLGRITTRGRVGALIALGAGFNPVLTGRENIYASGAILGLRTREIAAQFDAIVAFSGLSDFIDSPVQNYSSGMVVRLGFAVASSLQPDILLVDEVLAVGDATFRFRCIQRMNELRKDGVAILYVSHDLKTMRSMCEKGLVIIGGKSDEPVPISGAIASYEAWVRDTSLPRYDSRQLRSGRRDHLSIKSFRLLDAAGFPCGQFRVGEEIVLDIIIESIQDVERPGVAFGVEDGFGNKIIGWSSQYERCGVPMKAGQIRSYRLRFRNILRPSAYEIFITANVGLKPELPAYSKADDQIDGAVFFESLENPNQAVWTQVYNSVECIVTNAAVEGGS